MRGGAVVGEVGVVADLSCPARCGQDYPAVPCRRQTAAVFLLRMHQRLDRRFRRGR